MSEENAEDITPEDGIWDRENWRVLFLLSPSPGAVFRFLERRVLAGETIPSPLYLSDPAPPHGYRLLYLPTASRLMIAVVGARLSTALPRAVTLLYRRAGSVPVWGYTFWEGGEVVDSGEDALPKSNPWQKLTARLPGPASVSPPVAWANRRGLPLDRLPLVGRGTNPTVEYRTVAALDQRSLLVEDEPRLYRFEL